MSSYFRYLQIPVLSDNPQPSTSSRVEASQQRIYVEDSGRIAESVENGVKETRKNVEERNAKKVEELFEKMVANQIDSRLHPRLLTQAAVDGTIPDFCNVVHAYNQLCGPPSPCGPFVWTAHVRDMILKKFIIDVVRSQCRAQKIREECVRAAKYRFRKSRVPRKSRAEVKRATKVADFAKKRFKLAQTRLIILARRAFFVPIKRPGDCPKSSEGPLSAR